MGRPPSIPISLLFVNRMVALILQRDVTNALDFFNENVLKLLINQDTFKNIHIFSKINMYIQITIKMPMEQRNIQSVLFKD